MKVDDVNNLRTRIAGAVTSAEDAGYEERRQALLWNRLVPNRWPALIVHAAAEQDVVEAVRFASTQGLKVAVRGGGHSWIGFPLRDQSLLIDLGQLDRMSIDPDARTATVEPAVTGRALNRALIPLGLAFPVGHCPTVALSGYLLNGGFGWNANTWGPACFSVDAARVVTANGELVIANGEQHSDLFWALRGGGPGFCGVVTQYTLSLYAAPRAVSSTTHYYPLAGVAQVGTWLGGIAGRLPKEVELNLHIGAPAKFDPAGSSDGYACVVVATAFANSEPEASEMLGFMDDCPRPLADSCFKREVNQPTPIEALHAQGERIYPAGHRYLVSTLWTGTDSVGPVLGAAREQFLRAPSAKSLALCGFSTGLAEDAAPMPDTAFSMATEALLLHYAIWERPEDDAANVAWHRALTESLGPFAVGHYVGETDFLLDPDRAARCFAPAHWGRLEEIRRSRDPHGLFHGHFDPR